MGDLAGEDRGRTDEREGVSNRWESRASQALPEFGIRKIFERAARLEAKGREIIHLELGRPDFDTPDPIKEAAKEALDEGQVHYTPNWGTIELRQTISRHLEERLGVRYDPADEILVTVGTSEGLFLIMGAYFEPGDGVLVPSPGYPAYWAGPLWFRARPVPIKCPGDLGFQPDLDSLDPEGCRLMIINSPANPTGAVWNEQTLKGIADVAREKDLLLVTDEIYSDIVFEGRHQSIASLEGMRDRVLVLDGVSKSYSMTGWRVGYVAGPRQLIRPLYKLRQYNTVCAAAFAQAGARAALESGTRWVKPMVEEFRRRRDYLIPALNQLPGFVCPMPQGAFYAFPDIRGVGMSSEELSFYLLEEAGVATVPGSEFGPDGEGHIRISYAASAEDLRKAVSCMADALGRARRSRH